MQNPTITAVSDLSFAEEAGMQYHSLIASPCSGEFFYGSLRYEIHMKFSTFKGSARAPFKLPDPPSFFFLIFPTGVAGRVWE